MITTTHYSNILRNIIYMMYVIYIVFLTQTSDTITYAVASSRSRNNNPRIVQKIHFNHEHPGNAISAPSSYSSSLTHTSIDELRAKYTAKTPSQQHFVAQLHHRKNRIVIANGPAGTGKTLFACLQAIQDYESSRCKKIVLTRPTITVDNEDLGFLPGTVEEKMNPWLRPYFDVFGEYYSPRELDTMIHDNIIEVCPIAYMRGRTFRNAYVIADEMQNSTPLQMKTLTTRIGYNSKLVIIGDSDQSDRLHENGLKDLTSRFTAYNHFTTQIASNPEELTNNQDENQSKFHSSDMRKPRHIKYVKLDRKDVQRSQVVKDILNLYSFNTSYPFNITHMPSDTRGRASESENRSEQMSMSIDAQELRKSGRQNVSDEKSNQLIQKRTLTYTNGDCAMIPISQLPKNDFYDKMNGVDLNRNMSNTGKNKVSTTEKKKKS